MGRDVGDRAERRKSGPEEALGLFHASWSYFHADYGSSLEEDIQADTSGYLERILVCLLQVSPGS